MMGNFRSVHQQADKQERLYREQGVRGDARKAGLRNSDHLCEEGNKLTNRDLGGALG